mmetsp:Transcript_4682/g.12285  ORF Transcript_4682/g.12285 Transcript_4682/m.12285 type:complete len:107 (+) Transcript_4682:593-913(+)
MFQFDSMPFQTKEKKDRVALPYLDIFRHSVEQTQLLVDFCDGMVTDKVGHPHVKCPAKVQFIFTSYCAIGDDGFSQLLDNLFPPFFTTAVQINHRSIGMLTCCFSS